MVEQLVAAGLLIGEPRPIQHPVKFYERGERPLEIVTSRQWYIRNGGRDADLRAALVARGSEVTWHPAHMQHRYDNWVEGLNGDWLVSRQRFFGVPVPVWYPLDEHGEPRYDDPLLPAESRLPIDPSTDTPDGYTETQRGEPGGFVGDPDVFDTWATSSLTPQIAGRWEEDGDLFDRVFPMDMRPQAHDIIRTWLFSTMTRSHHEFGCAPWKHAALSGWILDPDRKKMSKSKGNVVTPLDLFETYGTDAVRYWAGSGRPGVDTAFSEDQMKVGRKLANKLLNVTKFVLQFGAPTDDRSLDDGVTDPIDRSMLAKLDAVVSEATEAFEQFDYARALERTESFFWWFCDNYVELVKGRTYDEAVRRPPIRPSARIAGGVEHGAAPVRADPAVRRRRVVALVERQHHPSRAVARPDRSVRAAVRRPGPDRRDHRSPHAGAPSQDRGQAEPARGRRGAGRHGAGGTACGTRVRRSRPRRCRFDPSPHRGGR